MGVSRTEMRNIHDNWREPPGDKTLAIVRDALNNLLGYPHGKLSRVEEMMGASREEMLSALNDIPGLDLR